MRVLAVLLLGLAGASCAVVGLDMGSSFIKVGVGRHGHGVQMALNDASKRKTPTAVGFHPEGPRRVWGDDALNLMNRHPGLSLPFSTVFLGEEAGSETVAQRQAVHPGYSVQQHNTRGSVLLGSPIGEMNHSVVPAEVSVGMLLQYAVQSIALEKNERNADGVVITVPGWSGMRARQAMRHAAAVAGIPVLSLINDHAAVALRYSMDQKFDSKPRYVMFFDMGGGGTKVSITSFHTVPTKDERRKAAEQVVVKAVAYDPSLGGRAFDRVVADMLIAEATDKLKNSTLSVRGRTRLHSAAEKARKVLSANKENQLSVDSLTEDFDLRMELTRARFEAEAEALFARVLAPVKAALGAASKLHGIQLEDLHSVELVGGGYRMPLVQSTLTEFFGKDRIKVSLNGDEAAALGATFYAAALKGYNVRAFNLVDLAPYDLHLSSGSEQSRVLFGQGSPIPVVRSIDLKEGITRVSIQESTGSVWSTSLDPVNGSSSLLLGLDRSGLPTIHGLQQFKAHNKKVGPPVWSRIDLNASALKSESSFDADEAERAANQETLVWWQEQDDDYRARSEAQNLLESYLFAARDAVESDQITLMSTEAERKVLTDAIEKADEWLLAGEASSTADFEEQRVEVLRLLEPLELRVKESEARPVALEKAKSAVLKVNNVLAMLKKSPVSNDSVVANATAADVARLDVETRTYDEWLRGKEEAQAKLNVTQHPVVLSTELEAKTKQLLVTAASVATRANLTAVPSGK